jgi:hypothetical protein
MSSDPQVLISALAFIASEGDFPRSVRNIAYKAIAEYREEQFDDIDKCLRNMEVKSGLAVTKAFQNLRERRAAEQRRIDEAMFLAAYKDIERRKERRIKQQQVGASIPGSKLIRDFCVGCGEAMRVPPDAKLGMSCCLDCQPTILNGKPPLQGYSNGQ